MRHMTLRRIRECLFNFSDLCFLFSSAEEEEGLSSDEDVPFRDDLNDQSYDPKAERFVLIMGECRVALVLLLLHYPPCTVTKQICLVQHL